MFKLRKLWWMALISAVIVLWYWQRQWATRLRALPALPSTTDSPTGSPFATDPNTHIIDHEPSWTAYAQPAPPEVPAPARVVAATEPEQDAPIALAPESTPVNGTPDQPDTHTTDLNDTAPAVIAPADAPLEQDVALATAPEATPANGTPDQPDTHATDLNDTAPTVVAPADAPFKQDEALAGVSDATSADVLAPETVAPAPAPPPDVPAPTAPAVQPARVNINTASIKKLTTLPGIGPTLAKRIVAYRKAHGPFTSVEELLNVQGIGAKNLKDFIDRIQV